VARSDCQREHDSTRECKDRTAATAEVRDEVGDIVGEGLRGLDRVEVRAAIARPIHTDYEKAVVIEDFGFETGRQQATEIKEQRGGWIAELAVTERATVAQRQNGVRSQALPHRIGGLNTPVWAARAQDYRNPT